MRFPEFKDNWNQKTLKDIISENLHPIEMPKTDYERLGLYCHAKGTFHEIVPVDKALDVDTMYVVPKDNLIVNITFAWEHAIAITTEKDAGKLVSHRFPTYCFNNGHFYKFYKYAILRSRFRYELGVASPGGAGRNRVLNKKAFLEIPMLVPSLQEQEKIAEFLFLVDERIEQQRQLVEALKRYKRGVINKVLSSIKQTDMVLLKDLVTKGHVKLGRGNVIPKYKKDESKIYPVYSSSTHNDGLMGFYDSFMFDNELITWSIDGGGNFFYRKKHKFNVTNVCGILELDSTQYNYKFIAECLIHQHERKHFDYLSKAHPSVIIDMYKLPNISIDVQQKYATLFLAFDDLIIASEQVVDNLSQVKTALLQQMFI